MSRTMVGFIRVASQYSVLRTSHLYNALRLPEAPLRLSPPLIQHMFVSALHFQAPPLRVLRAYALRIFCNAPRSPDAPSPLPARPYQYTNTKNAYIRRSCSLRSLPYFNQIISYFELSYD